jgi:poly-gamma-glutamate synthesis protein (capsule biosynthesis protein)
MKLLRSAFMSSNQIKMACFRCLLLLLAVVLVGCAGALQPAVDVSNPTETLPTVTATHLVTLTPTPTPTAVPVTLFVSDAVPNDVIDWDRLPGVQRSDSQTAALWLGPAVDALAGEVLSVSSWVYALAAPFPTLVDDITLSDLQAYWSGNPEGDLTSVPVLYVPEMLVWELSESWGAPDISLVEPYPNSPEIDLLWDTNAWVILPFEQLEPKLKVISLNDNSPLFKDFEITRYPLAIQFQLVLTENAKGLPLDAEISAVIDAIRHSNRDPDKMTTLVMTGVTALVRAIAYRMEIYGVLYPGEKIRDWLREADLAHISNEVSFYEDCPYPDPTSQRLLFCSDPKYIDLLDDVGADIIELTGNHNNDALYVYGFDAVPFTLDLYEQYGMSYFGGGRDVAEAKAPLLVTHNGNQLAFIGCNAFGPDFAWATEDQGGAAPCEDYRWMADAITRLRDEGYLPIATFQYFEDDYDFAVDHHIRDYGLMAEAGAVIVNGSQAHRPKSMAFDHDAFIDYGLGNFFFDQRWTIDIYGNVIVQTSWEIIQRHTFYEGRHLSIELLTAMLEDFSQPRPMTLEEREVFLTELFEASDWKSR